MSIHTSASCSLCPEPKQQAKISLSKSVIHSVAISVHEKRQYYETVMWKYSLLQRQKIKHVINFLIIIDLETKVDKNIKTILWDTLYLIIFWFRPAVIIVNSDKVSEYFFTIKVKIKILQNEIFLGFFQVKMKSSKKWQKMF